MRQQPIHLFNPLQDTCGGSEWRTISLYEALRHLAPTTIWSGEPNPFFTRRHPIRVINTRQLRFPKSGTFVFVGVYFEIGRWIHFSRPSRVILVYNTPDPGLLEARIRVLSRVAPGKIEIVYASQMMQDSVGRPGLVQPSLIDTRRFSPSPASRNSGSFVVGRHSRSSLDKHSPADAALYRKLAEAGCSVRIMGPSSDLVSAVGELATVELVPAGSFLPEAFLRGLDCFFYRTADRWKEPSGRVVTEAMACGLPVVCARGGGYEEYIEHGRNGFLVDSQEEAFSAIVRLKNEPELAREIGTRARATMEATFSSEVRLDVARFYLG